MRARTGGALGSKRLPKRPAAAVILSRGVRGTPATKADFDVTTGKWKQPDFAHRGWTCVDIDENPDTQVCEMCEVQEIRYVHRMEHPN
jgi:hypothetical protein